MTRSRQLATHATHATPEAALLAYDRLRRRPTQRMATMSRRVGRLAHARRLTPLRDAALRLALWAGGPPA